MKTPGARAFDLVLLDWGMGPPKGAEALRQVRRSLPRSPVAVLGDRHHAGLACAALAQGARSFIPKQLPPLQLADALRRVLAGGVYAGAPSAD
jgi:DNA-binding NarL/FixJ family response regulator